MLSAQEPPKTMSPKLRAMRIGIKRSALRIPEGQQYTSAEALAKAMEAETNAGAASHLDQRVHYSEHARQWLEYSLLLEEEELVAANA